MTATPLLDWQPRYPDVPGHKSPGPSQEAGEKVAARAPSIREGVKACLRANPEGLTADECAAMLGKSILGVRPRLAELHKMRAITETGRERPNSSGLMATVWRMA